MKKWTLVIFLGIALGFSCFVLWLAERPEPIEVLPDTFEAEVDYAVPKEHLLSVRVLDQRYTGHLTINTENLELPRLCGGFHVRITLDPAAPHPSEGSRPIQVSDLQVLEPPPGITDLTEQHLEGFLIRYKNSMVELLANDRSYHIQMPGGQGYVPWPGDWISVSYYPGPYPDRLVFVTEVKELVDAKDADWGIQLEVLDVTRYQCKLRIRKNSDFPFPLTVDSKISIYLPIPAETLPYQLSCLPPEAAMVENSYPLSGDDIFIIDFAESLFAPLQWSGIYKLEKTVYYGNTQKTYTVNFTISLPDVDLGEGKPWSD